VSSDDVDMILLSNIKVSKEYSLFSSICLFFTELCIFFTGSSGVKVSPCQIPRLKMTRLFCKLYLKLRLELCIVPSIYFCDSCFQFFALNVHERAYLTALGSLPNLLEKQSEREERRCR